MTNGTHALADSVGTGCAGADRCKAGTLESKTHRNVCRCHVADNHRNAKRRNAVRTAVNHLDLLLSQRHDAADTGSHQRTGTKRVEVAFRQAGLLDRFFCGYHCKLAVQIHVTCFALFNDSRRVEILDFCCNAGLVTGSVKTRNRRYAVFAGLQTFPVFVYGISDWCHCAHAGDDNTFHIVPPCLTAGAHSAVLPSTDRTCPVIYDALSDARKATASAISSGLPNRPNAMRDLAFSLISSDSVSVISV